MKKIVVRALALLAVASGAVLPMASPAQAAGRGDCPREYVCLWFDRNFTGSRWQGMYNNAYVGDNANDKASSSFNNGVNCTAYLWTDRDYAGVNYPLTLGSYLAYMNTNPGPSPVGSWEDVISSVHWCSPR